MKIIIVTIVLLGSLASSEKVCEIYKPVGYWLRQNPGKKCDVVKGPFLLDGSLAFSIDLVHTVFSNLTRIEGCIFLKTRTRLKDLSFMKNLKEIICSDEKASDWGFSDTIYIKDEKLNGFGLMSLEKIEGGGRIVVSFSEYDDVYDDMLSLPIGTKCFHEKEIRFFAQHPMYSGIMWKDCNPGPCTTARYFDEKIPIERVPPNCTLFYGNILLNGFSDFPILENLELLVGNIKIVGTFLEDLKTFPKLQAIYNSYGRYYSYENPDVAKTVPDAQLVILVNTTFLVNFSIPTLRTDRKIKFVYTPPLILAYVDPEVKLLDPCKDFEGAICEVQYERIVMEDNTDQLNQEFVACLVISIISLLITIRATSLLLWMHPGSFLPSARWMLGLIFVIIILVEIERIGFYQREMSVLDEEGNNVPRYLPLLQSSAVISPLTQFYQEFIVAAKHGVLPVFLLLALDYALFYRIPSKVAKRFSHIVLLLSFLICIILFSFLFPHLYYTIRVMEKPDAERVYGHSQQYFVPLVQDDQTSMKNRTIPGDNKVYAIDLEGADILGDVFVGYLFYVDGAIGYSFAILAILRLIGILDSWSTPLEFLLHLYFHLSINRLRWYGKNSSFPEYCGDYFRNDFSAVCKNGHPFQLILLKIIEKLPYLSFLLISIQCYRFARRQLFLAYVFDYRTKTSTAKLLKNESVSALSNSDLKK